MAAHATAPRGSGVKWKQRRKHPCPFGKLFMTSIMQVLRQAKDATVSWTLGEFIKRQIRRYGEMLSFNLDSTNKTMRLDVLLTGETEPVSMQLYDYQIVQRGPDIYFTFTRIEVSRPWMQALAEDLLDKREFKVPEEASKYVNVLGRIL
jgi:hypothetical protein